MLPLSHKSEIKVTEPKHVDDALSQLWPKCFRPASQPLLGTFELISTLPDTFVLGHAAHLHPRIFYKRTFNAAT